MTYSKDKKYTFQDHLLNICMVAYFILPQNMLLYLFVPISVFFIYDFKIPQNETIRKYAIVVVILSLFAFLMNVSESWYTTKSLLATIELVLLFIAFGRLKSVRIIKGYLIFLLIYLALFQFAYQLGLPGLGSLMTQIYPTSEETLNSKAFVEDFAFSDMGDYNQRLGGIYYNSNNCACFFEFLFSLILIERKQFKPRTLLILCCLLLICLFSTGSRTSFLVLLFLGFYYFRQNEGHNKVIFTLAALGGLYFILSGSLSNSRMFQVSDGLDSSFDAKIHIFTRYLEMQPNLMRLLVGSFSTEVIPDLGVAAFAGTDMEIGNLVVVRGFIFFFVLIAWLIYIFKNFSSNYKAIFCVFLWCFSNTIFSNYRALALTMLLLSVYFTKSRYERTSYEENIAN